MWTKNDDLVIEQEKYENNTFPVIEQEKSEQNCH